jgi:hypothetical protein
MAPSGAGETPAPLFTMCTTPDIRTPVRDGKESIEAMTAARE